MSITTTKLFTIVKSNNYHELENIIISYPDMVFNDIKSGSTLIDTAITYRSKECFDLLVSLPNEKLYNTDGSNYNTIINYCIKAPNEVNNYYLDKLISNNFILSNYSFYGINNMELLSKLFKYYVENNSLNNIIELITEILLNNSNIDIIQYFYYWIKENSPEQILSIMERSIQNSLIKNNLCILSFLVNNNIDINYCKNEISIIYYLRFKNSNYSKLDFNIIELLAKQFLKSNLKINVEFYEIIYDLNVKNKNEYFKFIDSVKNIITNNNIMCYQNSIYTLRKLIGKIILPDLDFRNTIDYYKASKSPYIFIWLNIWIENFIKYTDKYIIFDNYLINIYIDKIKEMINIINKPHNGNDHYSRESKINQIYLSYNKSIYLLLKYYHSDKFNFMPKEFEIELIKYFSPEEVANIDTIKKQFIDSITNRTNIKNIKKVVTKKIVTKVPVNINNDLDFDSDNEIII